MHVALLHALVGGLAVVATFGCGGAHCDVVAYTSVDQVFSDPVFRDLESAILTYPAGGAPLTGREESRGSRTCVNPFPVRFVGRLFKRPSRISSDA